MITPSALKKIIDYYWDPNKDAFSRADVTPAFIKDSEKYIKGKWLYRGRQGNQTNKDKFKIALTGSFDYTSRGNIDSWTYDFENGRKHARKDGLIMRIPKTRVDVVASMGLAVDLLYTVPMPEEYVMDTIENYKSEKEIIIERVSHKFTLRDLVVMFNKKEVQEMQSTGSKNSDFIFHSTKSDIFQLDTVDPRKLTVDGKQPASTDIDIIDKLKSLYEDEKVYPPVIDEKMNILDGVHRVIAAKQLHLTKIVVLKRVKFPAFND